MLSKKISKYVIPFYLFLMPFTAAFAVNSTLPLPLLFLTFILVISIIFGNYKLIKFRKLDILLIFVIILGIIPWLSFSSLSSKNLYHLLAIISSFLLYFIFVRSLLVSSYNFSWDIFSKLIRRLLFFLSLLIIVEFISASFFGVYFSDIIPFPNNEALNRPDLLNNFKRPRVFATEAGFTALYYDLFLPIAWVLRKKKKKELFLWGIILTGYFLLASAASMASLSFAFLIGYIFNKNKKYLIAFIVLLILLTIFYHSAEQVKFFFDNTFFRKLNILMNTSLQDMTDRPYIYFTSMKIVSEYPFGIGWGQLSQVYTDGYGLNPNIPPLIGGGAISLYLEIAVASGFLGVALFLFFISRKIYLLLIQRTGGDINKINTAVAISLMAIAFHHIFVSLYYFPFIWSSLALADYTLLKQQSDL